MIMNIGLTARAVPNIHFIFALVPNSGPCSLSVFGRIVK